MLPQIFFFMYYLQLDHVFIFLSPLRSLLYLLPKIVGIIAHQPGIIVVHFHEIFSLNQILGEFNQLVLFSFC